MRTSFEMALPLLSGPPARALSAAVRTSRQLRMSCEVCHRGRYSAQVEQCRVPSDMPAFDDELHTVWRCPNCQSIHSLCKIDLGPYYAACPMAERRPDSWTEASLRQLLRRLTAVGLTPASTILDHGGTESHFVDLLQRLGYPHATGYNPYSLRFNDARVLDNTYDFVFSNGMIEHVEDPRSYLQAMADLAAPGGTLVVCTPNAAEIDLTRQTAALPHVLHQPFQVHTLSDQAFRAMAQELGLASVASYRHADRSNWVKLLDAGLDGSSLLAALGLPKRWYQALLRGSRSGRGEMIQVLRHAAE